MIAIKPEPLERVTAAIFREAGSDAGEAEAVARRLVGANLAGHDSHGVVRIPRYVELMRTGQVAVNAHATIAFESDALAVVDGNRGFGQVIGAEAMAIGIAKARRQGVAAVALRHSSHLGRIGDWAEACAAAGCASIHFVNVVGAGALVAPFGGAERRISTNPFAAGMPVKEGPPIILDMATSRLAEGKVLVARNKRTLLPDGAIIDGQARPSRDPNDLYGPPEGALLPFGDHKGYGLAVFCDLLAGVFSAGGCNHPGTVAPQGVLNNMLSLVLDIARFGGNPEASDQVAAFTLWLKSAQPLSPGGEVLVPGEPEERSRAARTAAGIPLDDTTWGDILNTAAALGLARATIEGLVAG